MTKITQFYSQTLPNFCPLTKSKSDPDPKFVKHFTIRIQSKINTIHHSPDPIQVQSNLWYTALRLTTLLSYHQVFPRAITWLQQAVTGMGICQGNLALTQNSNSAVN